MKAISRIKKVVVYTNTKFHGYYKNFEIYIEFDGENYDICVTSNNGGGMKDYDGVWNNLYENATIEDAVEEALYGACLLPF